MRRANSSSPFSKPPARARRSPGRAAAGLRPCCSARRGAGMAVYRRAADLPQMIPVFPLDGALLLPGGDLPLQIFEPRYLNMIDDVMAGDRIVGMIQTRSGGDRERPKLADVGCAGRVTSYAETPDGRYLITLTGVCRFEAGAELVIPTPYRQLRARYDRFGTDLAEDGEAQAPE